MQAKLLKFVKSLLDVFFFKLLLWKNSIVTWYESENWKKSRSFTWNCSYKNKNQGIKSWVSRFEIRIKMCHKNFYILTREITQNVWNWCRWDILGFFNFFYAFGNNKKFLWHIPNKKSYWYIPNQRYETKIKIIDFPENQNLKFF